VTIYFVVWWPRSSSHMGANCSFLEDDDLPRSRNQRKKKSAESKKTSIVTTKPSKHDTAAPRCSSTKNTQRKRNSPPAKGTERTDDKNNTEVAPNTVFNPLVPKKRHSTGEDKSVVPVGGNVPLRASFDGDIVQLMSHRQSTSTNRENITSARHLASDDTTATWCQQGGLAPTFFTNGTNEPHAVKLLVTATSNNDSNVEPSSTTVDRSELLSAMISGTSGFGRSGGAVTMLGATPDALPSLQPPTPSMRAHLEQVPMEPITAAGMLLDVHVARPLAVSPCAAKSQCSANGAQVGTTVEVDDDLPSFVASELIKSASPPQPQQRRRTRPIKRTGSGMRVALESRGSKSSTENTCGASMSFLSSDVELSISKWIDTIDQGSHPGRALADPQLSHQDA
jgi:hypothetical protein